VLEVVAGVDHDGQPLRRQHRRQPRRQLRSADAAAEGEDVISSHAQRPLHRFAVPLPRFTVADLKMLHRETGELSPKAAEGAFKLFALT